MFCHAVQGFLTLEVIKPLQLIKVDQLFSLQTLMSYPYPSIHMLSLLHFGASCTVITRLPQLAVG